MKIEDVPAELAYLEAHHSTMPVGQLQHRRGAAMEVAKAALNDIAEAAYFDGAAYDRVYDLVLRLDRVGY